MTRRELFWGWVRGLTFFASFCVVLTGIMTVGIYSYYKPALAVEPICANRRCVTLVTVKPAGFDADHEYHVALREMRGPVGQFLVWDAASDPLPEPRYGFSTTRPRVAWMPDGTLHIAFTGPEPALTGTIGPNWTIALDAQ